MKPALRADGFTPHEDDRYSVDALSKLQCRFRLTPRGRVWSVFSGPRFCDSDVAYLLGLQHLIEFNLLHFTNSESRFTAAGFAGLIQHPRIQAFMDCNNQLLGDAAVQCLPGSRIRWLKTPNCGITDRGVSAMAHAMQLLALGLSRNKITDRSAAALCTLTNLRNLWLEHTELTSAGVETVASSLVNCHVHVNGHFGNSLD